MLFSAGSVIAGASNEEIGFGLILPFFSANRALLYLLFFLPGIFYALSLAIKKNAVRALLIFAAIGIQIYFVILNPTGMFIALNVGMLLVTLGALAAGSVNNDPVLNRYYD